MQSLIRTRRSESPDFAPPGGRPSSKRNGRNANALRRKAFGERDRSTGGRIRLVFKTFVVAIVATLVLTVVMALWGSTHTSIAHPPQPLSVNDVTQLNPIPVAEVVAPTTLDEIVAAVKNHAGPVSIGGGRYSMGGQTATVGAIQIDMRNFDHIVAFDSIGKTITVQPGITWRDIQRRIDPANLSVKVMQGYADFTVGGSMSVNAHGRDVGLGPIARSIRSFRIVLADGSMIEASPKTNADVFFGTIGGYGGLGVIVEATLDLTDNVRVRRRHERMPVTKYASYFKQHVRDSSGVVFHNAELYPPSFERVNAVTWSQTNAPVTVGDRLIPTGKSYGLDRFGYRVVSGWPYGKSIRERVVDPIRYFRSPVVWRNYESSRDVREVEPSSRASSTYVLEEYFIPVEQFDAFVPKMRSVFRKHDVNVINVSIRHAMPDSGTLLSWAQKEVFAFVVSYKQGTTLADRKKVGVWTKEMTDSVLAVGGTWYLPYQAWATKEQFLRAYPRAQEFFALKKRRDPTNKFRNVLWDKYYLPQVDPARDELRPSLRDSIDRAPLYRRNEAQMFLSQPEWYVVNSADEYAVWLASKLPTDFPYASAMGQYWLNYREARERTHNTYPVSKRTHATLIAIGANHSVELALRASYENTIGRFSGWTASHQLSQEDRYAATVAAEYAQFIHANPWYEFSYASRLKRLWTTVPLWGPKMIRKWERRFFLTAEYGFMAVYAKAVDRATRGSRVPQDERIQMIVSGWNDATAAQHPTVLKVARLDSVHTLVSVPRSDKFRDAMRQLSVSTDGVRISEIAGNREILLTGVAPMAWHYADFFGSVDYEIPLPTDPSRKRLTVRVPVSELPGVLHRLDAGGQMAVDHIYDY